MRYFTFLSLLAQFSVATEFWERPIPLIRFNYETREFERGKLTREGVYTITFRAEFPGEPPQVIAEPLASHLSDFWEPGINPLDHFWYVNRVSRDGPRIVETSPGEAAQQTQLSEIEYSARDGITLTLHFFEPGDPEHVLLTAFPEMLPYGVTFGSRNVIGWDRLRQIGGALRILCARLMALH